MPQFLLELFSEEIPARMQVRAIADLERLLNEALLGAGFLPEAVKGFAAPRRLTAVVEGLPARTADVREERKGPRVGAPEAAVQGFLKGAGLSSLDQARVVEDKKGAFYVADIVKPGQATPEALAALIPDLIARFPWPKSMRWGEGSLQWVRPLQRIVAVFDGAVVPFSVGGIESGAGTEGHRFHGAGVFAVRDFEDYEARLRAAGVILDREERKAIIAADARTLCQAQGLELVEDQGLLEEVAGLVDLPVVLMGAMDPAFLDLPPEVIRLTMRVNQKYFAVRDPATGGLAPKFIVVSNVRAEDGGAAILHGNGRVLTARLNDARYFWDLDRKTPLADRFARLETIVFHEKLGSVADKARRVAALAREIAPLVGADPDLCEQAAMLAKCDLATEMVGEFPELQGVMGRYYALENAGAFPPPALRATSPVNGGGRASAQDGSHPPPPAGEVARSAGGGAAPAAVADAIRDHYKPLGPSDVVPTEPVSVAVALADKLYALAAFAMIDQMPTGSGDPYALRRASLGLIRTILQNEVHLGLKHFLGSAFGQAFDAQAKAKINQKYDEFEAVYKHAGENAGFQALANIVYGKPGSGSITKNSMERLWPFILDRLRILLRDQGQRHDLIEAAFAVADDDIVRIVARLEALAAFLKTDAGANLIAGLKRAANILRAEERKGALPENLHVDVAHLSLGEEQALSDALDVAERDVEAALGREDFAGAMTALAGVRGAVDAFFEAVVVNAEDADLRRNRLALLAGLKRTADRIADFSRIEG